MILLVLLAVLLLIYGIINKLGKKCLLISTIIIILSSLATFFWYTTPTYIQISGMQGVNVNVETPQKDVKLEKEKKEQLVNILSKTRLYKGGKSTIVMADKSTCILINGRGVDEKYQHSRFYILHDRPNLSFAEIDDKKYKIDDADVLLIVEFLDTIE